MSVENDDSLSTITTQSGNNRIMFKNYHFELQRIYKNGSKIWFCTHKLCNASITTHDCSIVNNKSCLDSTMRLFLSPPFCFADVFQCVIIFVSFLESALRTFFLNWPKNVRNQEVDIFYALKYGFYFKLLKSFLCNKLQ